MDHKSTSEPTAKADIGVQTCCFEQDNKPTATGVATQTDNCKVCTHACHHGCYLNEQNYCNEC